MLAPINLASGRPIAAPAEDADIFHVVENLHRSLLVGAGFLVEIASYAMVAIIVIGPLLAWPRLRNTVLGWHISLGWWLFRVVLLTPLTGMLLSLHVGAPALPSAPPGAPAVMPARAIERVASQADLSGLVSARIFRSHNVLVTTHSPSGEATYFVGGDTVTRIEPGQDIVRQFHLGTRAGA